MSPYHNPRLAAFLESLHHKTMTDRADAIAGAIMETGGIWSAPPDSTVRYGDEDLPVIVEISLFGVNGVGVSTGDAVQCWMKTAERVLDDGQFEQAIP